MKTNENLVKLFEAERWLYVEGSLDEDRKIFWDNKISENQELEILLLEVQNFSKDFKTESVPDIDENKYNAILENVFNKEKRSSFPLFVKNLFIQKNGNRKISNSKLAFAGGIFFALISFLFLFQKPASKNMKNSKFLVWNDTSFSKNLSAAEFEYTNLADDKVAQYFQYRLANDKWLRDVVSIKNEIAKLNKTLNGNSF